MCLPRARPPIPCSTTSSSDTTRRMIPIHARADTYCEPDGSWYKQRSSSGSISWFKQYKTKACRKCPSRSQCTRSEKERLIQRSEYADYYEANRVNVKEKEQLYKRRQAIVEHPYGTIKRQWGFSYVITKKGICRAGSDVGFMFIAYNLRRIGNILTMNRLKEYLRILVSLFLTVLDFYRRKTRFCTPFFRELICPNEKQQSLKSL